ncbi:MAG: hypothetical protein ACREQC_01520, partial [Candidatus Binataceae bacterium]
LGLALASSLGIIAYTIILFVLLNRRTKNREQGALVVFFLKVTAASVAAGYVCFRLAHHLEHLIAWRRTLGSFEVLILVSVAGVLMVGLLMKLLRVRELDRYLQRVFSFAGLSR